MARSSTSYRTPGAPPAEVPCEFCRQTVDPRMHFDLTGLCPRRAAPGAEQPKPGERDDPSYSKVHSYVLRRALAQGRNSIDSRTLKNQSKETPK